MTSPSANELSALLCIGLVVVLASGPGLLLAGLTRSRWDDGGHGRRFLVALVNGGAVSAALTLAAVVLLVFGSMYDDRGPTGLEMAPACCCGIAVPITVLSFVVLFVFRRRDADASDAG